MDAAFQLLSRGVAAVLTARAARLWTHRHLYMCCRRRLRDLTGVVTEPEPAEFNTEIRG